MISFLLSVAFAADPTAPVEPGTTNPPTQNPPGTGTGTPGTGTPGTGTTGTQPGSQMGQRVVFEDIDTNKDLSLDRTEIAQNQMLVRDFTVIDTDKNGKLSRTEFQAWESRQGTLPGVGQMGQAPLFEDLDLNKDLNVDKTEISKLANLTRDFGTYDLDKNGKLSRTEFLSWRNTLGMPVFTDLDLNGDGSLDSSEINKNESIKRDLSTIDTDKNGKISTEEYQVWTSKAGRG